MARPDRGSGTGGNRPGLAAWRRGQDSLALVPVTASFAAGVLLGYGAIAPAGNPARGHRQLARHLERVFPMM